jgi:hypothetical protein
MARPPSDQHWQLFEHLYLRCPPPLHPAQFLESWEVSYADLAKLAGVSRSSIEHYMMSHAASHREPSLIQQRRLSAIDRLWRHVKHIPPELVRFWCESQDALSDR